MLPETLSRWTTLGRQGYTNTERQKTFELKQRALNRVRFPSSNNKKAFKFLKFEGF